MIQELTVTKYPNLKVAFKNNKALFKSECRQIDQLLRGLKIEALYTVFYNAGNNITRQAVIAIARRDGYYHLAQGLVREVLKGRFSK